MKHENTNALYLYWNRIRGARLAPERSAVEPADIRTLLKDTFILRVDDIDSYVFRLAGTRNCRLFGRELKETNFLSLLDGESREAVQTLLHSTCQDQTVNIIGLIGKNKRGQSMPLEALLLPIMLNGRSDQRIMGSMAPLKTPHWAGMEEIETLQLASLRIIMPHQHKTEISRPLSVNENRDQANPALLGSRRVGHLRVLDGGST